MNLANEFHRRKEVQKKKKLAFLRNEEYKDSDKDIISESEENTILSIDELENKTPLKKLSNEEISDKIENFVLENDNESYTESKIKFVKDVKNSKIKYSKIEKRVQLENCQEIHCSVEDLKFDIYPKKINIQNSFNDKNSVIESNFNKVCFDEENMDIKNEGVKINPVYNIAKNIKLQNSNRKSNLIDDKNFIINEINNLNTRNNSSIEINSVEENKKKKILIKCQGMEAIDIKPIKETSINKKTIITDKIKFDKMQKFIDSNKKKLEKNIEKEIKKNSENKADQILEISLNDYSNIEHDENVGSLRNVNIKNLNRIIRVRNILKGKYHGEQYAKDNNSVKKETDEEIEKIIRFTKLGPPSFLKTNFKKETNLKFKMLGGKYFGCKC